MKKTILTVALIAALCGGFSYVYAQAAITWPDRAALVDYIDNYPESHLQTLESILGNLAATPRQAAMNAIWQGAFGKDTTGTGADLVGMEQRAEKWLGRDVTVTETETDYVVTIPKE